MDEAQKQKIEAAIEAALRGVEALGGAVAITDEHGGVATLAADGTCTCGEKKCVHRMAFELSRMQSRIVNNDTQGLLRRDFAEMFLAGTVIAHVRREEEKAMSDAMDLSAGEPEMPYASILVAIQHHQHAARVVEERESREEAIRRSNHSAFYWGRAFALLLKELGVVGREEVFSYAYRGQEYRVTVCNVDHEDTATVTLCEEALALAEA